MHQESPTRKLRQNWWEFLVQKSVSKSRTRHERRGNVALWVFSVRLEMPLFLRSKINLFFVLPFVV